MKTTRNWWQHNTMKHQTFLFITSQFMFCTCYISCSTLKYLRQTRSRLNLIEFWWDVKVSGFHCVGQWGSVLYFICCTADHVQRAKWRDTIILHYGKSRNQVFWKLTLTSDCPSPTALPDKNKNILHFFRNVMDFVEWRCFQNSVFLQYLWKTTTSSELVLILWTEGLYLIAHALILKVTKRHYTFLIPFSLFNPAVGRMHGDEVCLLVTVQDCKKNCHMMVKPTNYMQHRNKGATLFRCRTSGLQGGFFSQFILSNLP